MLATSTQKDGYKRKNVTNGISLMGDEWKGGLFFRRSGLIRGSFMQQIYSSDFLYLEFDVQ